MERQGQGPWNIIIHYYDQNTTIMNGAYIHSTIMVHNRDEPESVTRSFFWAFAGSAFKTQTLVRRPTGDFVERMLRKVVGALSRMNLALDCVRLSMC